MTYLAIIAPLLAVLLLISFTIRTDKWRNRRKESRRKVADRRSGYGRRLSKDELDHSSAVDRRGSGSDRRGSVLTRRRKNRREEDRMKGAHG